MKGLVYTMILSGWMHAVLADNAQLDRVLDESWSGNWEPVQGLELVQARTMFRLALRDPDSPLLDDILRTLEFRITRLPEVGMYVLHEAPSARTGRGVFVFREHEYFPVLLQVPHARADLHTGMIARRWMQEMAFQVMAMNTVHRRSGPDADAADLARQPQSYFMALLMAYADQWAEPKVYQVHGFAAGKRSSETGRTSDFILSSGRQEVAPPLLALAGCLRPVSRRVSLYPVDVQELGGTINPVSRWFRDQRLPGYAHLEMSLDVREKLITDEAYRQMVGQCLSRS